MKLDDLLITDDDIETLVRPLSDSTATKDVFAAMALSHISEPGDRVLGRLVSTIGATRTLGLLIHRVDAAAFTSRFDDLAAELAETFNLSFSQLWQDATSRWLPRLNLANLKLNLRSFAETNGKVIARENENFPQSLLDLEDAAPVMLWLRGNAEALNFEKSLAIVGSRIATAYGNQVSADLAEVCAEKRVTTISGGAFGVDSLVHRASLELDSPTVAVLAGGLDHLYPKGNAPLFERMLRNNAIIAEVAPTVAPAKWRFLMRNRLIAALGEATVVVEAGSRSGSMSTAGHALNLGRRIGIVPGRIYDSSSRGCLNLLRENPGLVEVLTCAQDALDLIDLGSNSFELREPMSALETRALDAFAKRTLSLLDVQRIAGLTFSEAQLALGKLELAGYLERQIDGYRKVQHNLDS